MNRLMMVGLMVGLVGVSLPALSAQRQEEVLAAVRFDQRIGAQLPERLQFQTADGVVQPLSALASDRPLVLVFSWFDCPNLCPLVLDQLARASGRISLAPSEYRVAVISIDPQETPADARRIRTRLEQQQGPATHKWHFLTGTPDAIQALTDRVGFGYRYDAERDRYAHPAGLVVASPGGRISHYLLGVRPEPTDLKLALLEAGQGRLGNPVDQALLRCYRFNPETGQYSLAVTRLLQWVGSLFLVLVGACFVRLKRRRT